MAIAAPQTQKIDGAVIRTGDFTTVIIIPMKPNTVCGAGIGNAPLTTASVIKLMGVFCTLQGTDSIPLEPIQTTEVMGSGFKSPRRVTSGVKIPDFTMTLMGNAVSGIAAATGHSLTAYPGMVFDRVDFGQTCHIIINGYATYNDGTVTLSRSDCYTNMSAKITELPGVTEGGVTSQTITFYSDRADSQFGTLQGQNMWVCEAWIDNATVLSSSIPGSTFDLGTGNDSYASATTPVAINFDDRKAGADKRFLHFSVNGVQYTAADGLTFSAPTITSPVAAAVPGSVVAIYAMDVTSVLPPHGQGRTVVASANYSWQEFMGQ